MKNNNIITGYASIDRPWLQYYSEEDMDITLPEYTVYENIYHANKDYLSDVALMYFGKKITYKNMFKSVDETAKAFVANGISEGDSVAVCMTASPEAIYTILALNKIGANVNMVNPTYSTGMIENCINLNNSLMLITFSELYNVVKDAIPHTTIRKVITSPIVNSLGHIVKAIKKVKKIEGTTDWNDFIAEGKHIETPDAVPYKKNMPAIVVYTSGSSGIPKAIQLSNDSINGVIKEGIKIGIDFKREERWFSQIPIFVPTGICAQTLVPLKYGITIILEPLFDNELLGKHIMKYKPNFMISARGLLDHIAYNVPNSKAYKNFKYICAGGEYITPSTEVKYNEWLASNGNTNRMNKGYGMSECCGTVCATSSKCNEVGSVGIPTPGSVIAAFNIVTGEELKYGERGELRIQSKGLMLEYYNNPEATEKFFHTDENGNVWARTGDMGYVNERGSVFVLGRIQDSYISEDNNTVYLFDIERAVFSSANVKQCRVVSSEIDGKETHVAHIALVNGVNVDEVLNELKEICDTKLDTNHALKYVKLYEETLPFLPSGKLDGTKMKKDIENIIKI